MSIVDSLLKPVTWFILRPTVWRHLWLVPPLFPSRLLKRYAPKAGPWPVLDMIVPESTKTIPGIRRDPAGEEEAFRSAPLQDWLALHDDSVSWFLRHSWRVFVPFAPRVVRAVRRASRVGRRAPAPAKRCVDSDALAASLKRRAAELGLSAVGVAMYDEKYTFASCRGSELGDRIVVCMLEQNWEATQTIPSIRAERSAMMAYAGVIQRATTLVEWIQEQGFRAKAHDLQGDNVVIHYAVEAGLGQLGLNGQVLTPGAGSRCRVVTITTDAPFALDHPVDYGINRICDECQVCVRRCPSGAITNTRKFHRGVEKAKINTARCFPVVVQSHGCAICMKVCPVQRYGLEAVMAEFESTGRILGKDTDELEGYHFEGRYYGAEQRPRLRGEWFKPSGFPFDPERTLPREDAARHWG